MKTLKDYVDHLAPCVLRAVGNPTTPIAFATDDSRLVAPNALFCAVRGAMADGHHYIPQAVSRGATALMVTNETAALSTGLPYILVSDDYHACALAAELSAGFPAQAFETLAVTGTNGKTTSAYLLHDILTHANHDTAMIGTVLYDLAGNAAPIPADRTTPPAFKLQKLLTTIREHHASHCVMEVSSHALSLHRLGTLKFRGAIFTNLTQEHLDYHKTLEQYYQAKKRLFTEHLISHAVAVINLDDAYGKRLFEELADAPTSINRIGFTFTETTAAAFPDAVLIRHLALSSNGTQFTLPVSNTDYWDIQSPLVGAFNAYNIAGAVLLAAAIGVSRDDALAAIRTCIGAPGRLQRIQPTPENPAVFIDYAHTPDALQTVLKTLRAITRGKLICVFGCGGDRDRTKRPVMGSIAAELADLSVITSDNPRTESPEAIIQDIRAGISTTANVLVEPDRFRATQLALRHAQTGDTVLIAGKGHEDYQEINHVQYPYSDADVVADILSSRKP